MGEESNPDVLFPTLVENADGSAGTEIESLCMNCHKQGITRILMTIIPFFKEVVIMSFDCEHCGFRSSEIQPGGEIMKFGVHTTCKIENQADFQRSVLISDSAVVKIPEVELEIPCAKRGRLTTVEGVINEVMDNLNMTNDELRKVDPEGATQVAAFVARLAMLRAFTEPFHIDIRDPSGNSAIEGLEPGKKDEKVTRTDFKRSADENLALGLNPITAEETDEEQSQDIENGSTIAEAGTVTESGTNDDDEFENETEEIMILREDCPACGAPGENRMKVQTIPFFKEVVLMAFVCDKCGYRSTEVKPTGQISDKGRKTILEITMKEDLSRDLLKSDTAIIDIPEIELTLEAGTLGSMFTTIEGMLLKVKENLMGVNPFSLGDSASELQKSKFQAFYDSLDKLIAGDEPFTLILDDPAGNSYIQNIYAPDPDPEMKVQEYERDEEQDDELGLSALKV